MGRVRSKGDTMYPYVEVCSLYIHFVENYFNKWMLNLVKRFSTYIELYSLVAQMVKRLSTMRETLV